MSARAVGIAVGYAADRLLGDPSRWHPVAGFGALSVALERHTYADSRVRGAIHLGVLVGGVLALGAVAERMATNPVARCTVTASCTWVVLGGRSLEREAAGVHDALTSGDLALARTWVQRLVGRDTADLDAPEVARAVVESVAENTSDAVIAPLVWGGLLGVPGLLGYRAINTLDAMIGHRNARYELFGCPAARLDDLANIPAARLTGILVLLMEPQRAGSAWLAWRRDAPEHPSPNAGVAEATFAGALGVRLGGVNRYYGSRIEHRAVMGDGRSVGVSDIPAATALARKVGLGAAVAAAILCLWRGNSRV